MIKVAGKYLLLSVAGAVMTVVVFMLIPRTAMTEWLGVGMYQDRLIAVQNGVFWQVRSVFAPSEGEKIGDPLFGRIEGLTEDGRVVLKIANGRKWLSVARPLAGVEIRDNYRAAMHLRSLKDITAQIDMYAASTEGNSQSAVVWVRGRPVNLVLVEDGLARPEPNPETSITDAAYAAYYWRLARGLGGRPEQKGAGERGYE